MRTLSPINWVLAPVQMDPLDPLEADWHFTLTNGVHTYGGEITNMTISAAFWWLAKEAHDKPGRWVGTLLQIGGGEMWAGHVPPNV